MIKVAKLILIVNGTALLINGIVVWLVIAKTFPLLLGALVFFGFFAGAVWLSCYMNGALPRQRRHAFYSTQTEKAELL